MGWGAICLLPVFSRQFYQAHVGMVRRTLFCKMDSHSNVDALAQQQQRRSIFGGWLFGGAAREKQDTHVRHIHSDADAYEVSHDFIKLVG